MEQTQVTRFTTLWTQAQTSVFALISSTITNFADAEDVLQKVAAISVSKFDDFDADGDSRAFIAWVFAIARYEVLRHLRSCATDRHKCIADSIEEIAVAFEQIEPEFEDRRVALAECSKQLQGRSREVLEKRYGQGLKTRAIAEALGLTAGNVSVILNRAYQTLRQCVERRLAGEGGL